MDKYKRVKDGIICGRGSVKVYKVTRNEDEKLFALKEIDTEPLKVEEKGKLKKEIEKLKEVRHPNITEFVENFEDGIKLCIVMEYCGGGDLEKLIQDSITKKAQRGPGLSNLSEEEIMRYFCQICLAISYLHLTKLIIHRDIKGESVLLATDGTVKLEYFGITKQLDNSLVSKSSSTAFYCSPEFCNGKEYTNKSDIWALGVLLYRMATAKYPFDGTQASIIYDITNGVYEKLPDKCFTPDFISLVNHCLSVKPEERCDIKEILSKTIVQDALEKFAQEEIKRLPKPFQDVTNNFNREDRREMISLLREEREEMIISKGISKLSIEFQAIVEKYNNKDEIIEVICLPLDKQEEKIITKEISKKVQAGLQEVVNEFTKKEKIKIISLPQDKQEKEIISTWINKKVPADLKGVVKEFNEDEIKKIILSPLDKQEEEIMSTWISKIVPAGLQEVVNGFTKNERKKIILSPLEQQEEEIISIWISKLPADLQGVVNKKKFDKDEKKEIILLPKEKQESGIISRAIRKSNLKMIEIAKKMTYEEKKEIMLLPEEQQEEKMISTGISKIVPAGLQSVINKFTKEEKIKILLQRDKQEEEIISTWIDEIVPADLKGVVDVFTEDEKIEIICLPLDKQEEKMISTGISKNVPAELQGVVNEFKDERKKIILSPLDRQEEEIMSTWISKIVPADLQEVLKKCQKEEQLEIIKLSKEEVKKEFEMMKSELLHPPFFVFNIDNLGSMSKHGLRTVTTINLRRNKMTDEMVKDDFCKYLINCDNLTNLELCDNEITAVGAAAIADSLSKLKTGKLTFLDLSYNPISDEGAAAIAAVFPHFKSLIKLYLYGTTIGEEGVKAVADKLPSLISLVWLNLGGNNIRDQGAKVLVKVVPSLTKLKEIDLRYNQVSETGRNEITGTLQAEHKEKIKWL